MEAKLFWKSVIRRKGSLLVLLILISMASFGFMLRVVEYLAVSQEIDRISRNYRMIGTLSSPDEFVTEGIPLLEACPYVDFVDINRECPGVLSDIYNVDVDGSNSYNEKIMGFHIEISDILVWAEVSRKVETNEPGVFQYDLRVIERVFGYPEYTEQGRMIRVFLGPEENSSQKAPEMEKGKTYLIRAYYDTDKSGNRYGEGFYFELKELAEGIWFLEGEPDDETARQYVDEYDILQERNRHAISALTTKDMSAMQKTQEASKEYYLESGRWLNRQDYEESRKVCVIAKEFADLRGLQVGDTLSLELLNARLPYFGYVTDLDEDPGENCEKIAGEFEVVGVYDTYYAINLPGWSWWSAYANYIYIPDSCVPEHYIGSDEDVWQASFCFVLTSPEVKDAFLQEMEGELKALGLSVAFLENNWDAFSVSAKGIRQGAFYSFLVFTAVLVIVIGAVAFLYSWQRKKETAIARALGVPAGRTVLCACLPVLVLGAAGILIGGGLAWGYGLKQAEKTLAVLEEGGRTELSIFWFVAICLAVWLYLGLAVLAGIAVHTHKPVLEILQGNPVRGKKAPALRKVSTTAVTEERDLLAVGGAGQELKSFQRRNSVPDTGTTDDDTRKLSVGRKDMTVRFVGRHLRRFSFRSVFALLAAAVFVTASCWLQNSIREGELEVDHLYQSTEVEAEIVKREKGTYAGGYAGAFISTRTIQELEATGFIKDCYLEAAAEYQFDREERRFPEKKKPVLGVADIEEFLSHSWNNEMEICYGDGYGKELFEKDYTRIKENGETEEQPVIILPKDLWESWELEPGEMLKVTGSDGMLSALAVAGGYYTGGAEGLMEGTILVPLSFMEYLDEGELYYLIAQFILAPEKNRQLEEFREKSKEIIENPYAGLQGLSFLIRDSELKQNVEPMEKNITLMRILYPIANIVSFLAAIGLSILFLFQRRQEAAILRVLGVKKGQTRAILALELLILNIAGMALGVALTVVLVGAEGLADMLLASGCYFVGCLIGTIAGSVWVTGKSPMVLLQEKE